jgi:hypothetical protein
MKKITTTLVLFAFLLNLPLYCQEPSTDTHLSDLNQARLIKVERMSEAWKNERMELRLFNGTSQSGRFLSLQENMFLLKVGDDIKQVPLTGVESVILKRKPSDLLFVGLTTVGVAGLFAAGTSLMSNTSDQTTLIAGGVGAVLGFGIGWKAFFQDMVIRLD